MGVYTKAFAEIAEKYNIEATMWFSFETDSEKVMKESDLMS